MLGKCLGLGLMTSVVSQIVCARVRIFVDKSVYASPTSWRVWLLANCHVLKTKISVHKTRGRGRWVGEMVPTRWI